MRLLLDHQKTLKRHFSKGPSGSVINHLWGCTNIEAVPSVHMVGVGTFGVKPAVNGWDWYFSSDNSHSPNQRYCCQVSRAGDQQPVKGSRSACVFLAWVPAWWLLDPSKTRARLGHPESFPALRTRHFIPLTSFPHVQERDGGYLLRKVLWDLLGLSAFKRCVFPFLYKAQRNRILLFLPWHFIFAASEEKQEMVVILRLQT